MDARTRLEELLAGMRAAAAGNDSPQAVRLAQEVAREAGPLGEARAAAEAETVQTQHCFYLGRFDEALRHGQRALDAWRALDEPAGTCEALMQMSHALSEEEVGEEGLLLAQEALRVAEAHGLVGLVPRALVQVGILQMRLRDWDEAESVLLHALSLARDGYDTSAALSAMNALLSVLGLAHREYRQAGDPEKADAAVQRLVPLARRALVMATDEPLAYRRQILRSNAAEAFMACGEPLEARALLDGVIREAFAEGFRVVGMRAMTRRVQTALQLQDLADAAAQLAGLEAELDREDHPIARSALIELGAELARAAGDAERAAQLEARAATQREWRVARSRAMQEALSRQPEFRRALQRAA